MPKKNEKKSKKKWLDIEITRVKLTPEQAVLACCQKDGTGYSYECGSSSMSS